MAKKILLVFVGLLMLSSCAMNFKKMGQPIKAVSSIARVEQVQAAAKVAGNQPGIVELAKRTREILKQVTTVYNIQYQNFSKGTGGHYSESKDLALKLVPEIWKLARDARALYFTTQLVPSPSNLSTEGVALAKQVFAYADLSSKAIALDIAYPYAGIEWDAKFMSISHEHEANAYNERKMNFVQKINASTLRFVGVIASVQASGVVVPIAEPQAAANHTIVVSVVGKASQSDRDKLASKLRKVAAEVPPLPHNLSITVNLTHLGGTIIPLSRIMVLLTQGLTSLVAGSSTFSASAQVGSGKPIPLGVDQDAMKAKETEHLVTLATYTIISRAVVVAYGEGW